MDSISMGRAAVQTNNSAQGYEWQLQFYLTQSVSFISVLDLTARLWKTGIRRQETANSTRFICLLQLVVQSMDTTSLNRDREKVLFWT